MAKKKVAKKKTAKKKVVKKVAKKKALPLEEALTQTEVEDVNDSHEDMLGDDPHEDMPAEDIF